ncbi:aminomethyl-transferring glycine dehydrogenase, partial [Verrucomicrobia bacterium]|nr:aminomethyl-transferring glycine dehydrogenase [Verrucomicrobiota bacterium]
MDNSQTPFFSTAFTDRFDRRHIGPSTENQQQMLATCGVKSMDQLIDQTVPAAIRLDAPLDLPEACSEFEALARLKEISEGNEVYRSFIGQGYHDTIVPPVIQRNVLENPGWYTQYTPYQAEISQGRMECLLNFQTMISELTGMDIANASLLDEGTAAAEAMTMAFNVKGRVGKKDLFLISSACHPQSIDVVVTRAEPLGIRTQVVDDLETALSAEVFGVLVQFPDTTGAVIDHTVLAGKVHDENALIVVAADLLSLVLLTPPGEFGADVVVGNSQRFGVPMGYGGPHAAFFATRDSYKRRMPGRLVGVSRDVSGKAAFRLSLQTREQHIRRDKATSNICTAQALLANMAALYAVYHGADGLRGIANRVHGVTCVLAQGLKQLGLVVAEGSFFDTLTLTVEAGQMEAIQARAEAAMINLRFVDDTTLSIALDECVTVPEVQALWEVVSGADELPEFEALAASVDSMIPDELARKSEFLTHAVFNQYHSETEMMRYLRRLESRDLSLTRSMIPLGSCTMKLNATVEMFPVSWPEFGKIHPFAPLYQLDGYQTLFNQLEKWLTEITGFAAVSLQPNAGSAGEYAGLLAIRRFHEGRGDQGRIKCLIPQSAHGTNPASAVMAGMQVVPVKCDEAGNVDVTDLKSRIGEHRDQLAALMITYPSTHGVFEESIREICDAVHEAGGQVYMDGANMNAQVGLCSPGDIGADVCHLNLHKTFCIPHGGGGPGVGPIGVAAHLAPFLPGHSVIDMPGVDRKGAVAAAPWGSASILPISWVYIVLMGEVGLKRATEVAILNANYIAARVQDCFPVLYKGTKGRVAHECIVDLRQFKVVTVEDVAKRLMDYGFHAPTISWPVAGTMM